MGLDVRNRRGICLYRQLERQDRVQLHGHGHACAAVCRLGQRESFARCRHPRAAQYRQGRDKLPVRSKPDPGQVKSAAFEYSRPVDLAEACAMLAQGDDARLIAGGQTLVPLMAMRLARPKRLIDIARVPELAFVRKDDRQVTIGATTKQCVIERDPLVRTDVPLLAKVMPFVGHAPIRARGTVGGSLANGDPAAEIALVAVTLGATLLYREGGSTREIAAGDFFTGPMVTALSPAACLISARFPIWKDAAPGTGFHEVNARRSDFAFASAAAQIVVDEE